MYIKLSVLFFCAVFLTACASKSVSDDGRIKAYATFCAVYDFAEKITGDKMDLELIVPMGLEPHEWEPTPKEMAALTGADIIFYNGLGMEGFIERLMGASDGTAFAELSEGIPATGSDPHVWLSPLHAKRVLENVLNAAIQADPENAAYYESNYKFYADKLDKLHGDYTAALAGADKRDIVVAHEAYGYLCDAYGLNQIAIDGLSSEYEPSPAKMAEIIDYINDNKIEYIFFEGLSGSKAVEAIAKETGAQALVLSPYESLTGEQAESGWDYFTVMYENLENLKRALCGETSPD